MVTHQINKGLTTHLLCTLQGITEIAEVKWEVSLQSSVRLDCWASCNA